MSNSKRQINLEDPFNTEYFDQYYSNYRNKIEDLFPSERRFLSAIVSREKTPTILDVGCAQGGMFEILRSINQNVKYVGVDISKKLIECARFKYPSGTFCLCDGVSLPFETGEFDTVISFGTTVHDQNYQLLLRECLRVARKNLLFDIRLVPNLPTICDIDHGFVMDGVGFRYPYIVVNDREFSRYVSDQLEDGVSVSIYGYWGKANEFTTLPAGYEDICMTAVLLRKMTEGQSVGKVETELPFDLNAG